MMAIEPGHPEIPYPLPPERLPPRRTEPPVVPIVSFEGGDAWERLDEQRRILVSGRLDHDAATALAAKLMAFDGASSRDVEIVINSGGGPLEEIFAVLDVLRLMRARTHTTCIGSVVGTAAAVVACGTGTRRAATNATLCLRIDDRHTIEGTTSDIVRDAEALSELSTRYVATLAGATHLDAERLAVEIRRGTYLTAAQARDLGILDRVDDRSTSSSTSTAEP
jgi:ATP-dependent Clp protease protease subunit